MWGLCGCSYASQAWGYCSLSHSKVGSFSGDDEDDEDDENDDGVVVELVVDVLELELVVTTTNAT